MPEPFLSGLRGFLIDSPTPGTLRGVRDGAIVIEDGAIADCGPGEVVETRNSGRNIRWRHSPDTVIIPGLVDLHAQIPQYPVIARSASQKSIATLEKEFRAKAASTLAPAFFADLARHGTTCALLYASAFEDSCNESFVAADAAGMRATIGMVLSDGQPLEKSLEQSETLCRRWHKRDSGRLHYAFGTRSALVSSPELLQGVAALASKYDAYYQADLAVSPDEAGEVRAKFSTSALEKYRACGLLGPRSVFAHAIHLTDEEIALLGESRSAVAHTPTADLFNTSGLMPLDRLRKAGVRVGLASGIAGGPELNMWQIMRSAIESQKARFFHDPAVPVPTPADAFHLATMGGAEALGQARVIGTIDIGKDADLVVIDLARILPTRIRTNPHAAMSADEIVSLLVYRGGPGTVLETLVRGRAVHHSPDGFLL